MRRAGHKRRAVSVRSEAAAPQTGASIGIAVANERIGAELLPALQAARICPDALDEPDARHRALEVAVQQRIQSRLPGRVRNLVVRSFENIVILEGQCATYYTKQLAQHAAMGILEDAHLENAIIVTVPK